MVCTAGLGRGDRRARGPRPGPGRPACADVAGSARHAVVESGSDAGRKVRQHGPDRGAPARPTRAGRPPGPAAGERVARDRTGTGALALGSVCHAALAAPQPQQRVRARELHPAGEPRDDGGAAHRSGDRAHGAAPGAQLPDRRRRDRACASKRHDGGHRAGGDDRAADPDPGVAARLSLAGGRCGAPGDGRRDRDGRPWPAVACQLPHADQLAGRGDRRDDEPRSRGRLRAADGLARAPGAGRRLRPGDGDRDRVSGCRTHDRGGGRHAGADDARGERGGDAGAARPGGNRSGHLGPSQRRAGADRDAGAAAPARPLAGPLADPAYPLAHRRAAHQSGTYGGTPDRPPRDYGPADPPGDAGAGGPRGRAAHGPAGRV